MIRVSCFKLVLGSDISHLKRFLKDMYTKLYAVKILIFARYHPFAVSGWRYSLSGIVTTPSLIVYHRPPSFITITVYFNPPPFITLTAHHR
jgi:hypothetical protein